MRITVLGTLIVVIGVLVVGFLLNQLVTANGGDKGKSHGQPGQPT